MTKRNFIVAIILMLFMVSSTGFTAERYQWKHEGTEDGCQIYTSNVAGFLLRYSDKNLWVVPMGWLPKKSQ